MTNEEQRAELEHSRRENETLKQASKAMTPKADVQVLRLSYP